MVLVTRHGTATLAQFAHRHTFRKVFLVGKSTKEARSKLGPCTITSSIPHLRIQDQMLQIGYKQRDPILRVRAQRGALAHFLQLEGDHGLPPLIELPQLLFQECEFVFHELGLAGRTRLLAVVPVGLLFQR